MKYMMMLLFAVCFLAVPIWGTAQEDAAATKKRETAQPDDAAVSQKDVTAQNLAKLLDDDTIYVVHIDLTKIDTSKVLNNNREIIEKYCDAIGLTQDDREQLLQAMVPGEKERDFVRNWDRMLGVVGGGKAFLTEALGVKDVFLIFKIGGNMFPATVYAAIPMHDELNTTTLDALLGAQPFVTKRTTDDFYLITFISNAKNKSSAAAQYSERLAATLGPGTVKERPEMIEAYQTVKDYPIQLLYAAPKYIKRVLSETLPEMPKPFDKIAFARFISGIRWKAVGLDLEQTKLLAIGEAETELDAQIIYYSGREFLELMSRMLLEQLKKYADDPSVRKKRIGDPFAEITETLCTIGAYPTFVNEENLKLAIEKIVPKPEGKRFTIVWDKNTLQDVMLTAGPTITKMVQKGVEAAGLASQRMHMANQFKQIGLAMHNYHDTHKVFPPAYTVDKNGKPLHSWRVLILPYMEQYALYEKIRLDEPWDSEYNKQFHSTNVSTYLNPYGKSDKTNGVTNYCLITGNQTFGQTNGEGIKIGKLSDGTSNTIMAAERKTPVCWMSPNDITQDDAFLGIDKKETGIGGSFPDGVTILLCDGSIHFLENTVDLEKLRALLTISREESVSVN